MRAMSATYLHKMTVRAKKMSKIIIWRYTRGVNDFKKHSICFLKGSLSHRAPNKYIMHDY